MDVLASKRTLDFKTSMPSTKRIQISLDVVPVKKRRLISADSFCFSLEDLNSRLYSKHDMNTVRSDQEDDSTDEDFCFWCDAKKYNESFKCPYHDNQAMPNKVKEDERQPYAYQNIPSMLQFYSTNTLDGVRTGMRTVNPLPAGAWIGPFEGILLTRDEVPLKTNYMWEIFKDRKLYGYIDASDENKSSWMRFIRRARHQEEQNLWAFQYQDKIYYRAYKTIRPGQELLVWYDKQYRQYSGIPGKDELKGKEGEYPDILPSLPSAKAVSEQRDNTSAANGDAIQMETTFTRIGALLPSPTKLISQAEIARPRIDVTQPIPDRPLPRVSTGFSLKIENGNFTRPTHAESDRQSPTTPTVPSPKSPSTPNSSDSDCSLESGSAESPTKTEANEISVWRCGQCKKSFAQRTMLQIHVCSQVPFRPYKCGHCDRSFCSAGVMRAHAVVHQGKKPFKCGYCSRAFSGATTLNNHIRIHTGEKPFRCEKCGKIFSQGSQLSKHERIPGDCVAI